MREVVGSSPTATTNLNPNFLTRFAVDHVACNVEPGNEVSKGVEHPLDISISGWECSPPEEASFN